MFKDKKFRVRSMQEIFQDIDAARAMYRYVERIFLCDGDALCLAADKLLAILNELRKKFPECRRINVYGSPKDVLRKTPEELRLLREAGMKMIYIGAESGSDKVLAAVQRSDARGDYRGGQTHRGFRDSGVRYLYFRTCRKRRMAGSRD